MAVSTILDQDLVGVLLPELVVSLILLQLEKTSIFNYIQGRDTLKIFFWLILCSLVIPAMSATFSL